MDSPLISVRVVNVDWYLSDESRLPVVRIFGSTPAGQRACLHLHGALPYFMVRPMDDENSAIGAQFEDPDSLNALLPQLEVAVESAMAASSARAGDPPAPPQNQGRPSSTSFGSSERRRGQQRVVARLEVVRGIPFYGYHGEEKLFVKVYVSNPALTGKLASVLQAGHVLSTRFQPYESHVPFLLQVFIDYNISGMSYVHLKNALFLAPLPERSSVPASQRDARDKRRNSDPASIPELLTSTTVPEELVARPPSQSAMTEQNNVDASVEHRDAARDLLSGISMSQLFSQPSSSPPPTGFRPYRESSPPQQVSSPWKAPKSNNKSRARTIARWWERQTATELEITGTVEDVINPSLLVAGRAGEGGNMMAVASLRELWDEEKGRSRAAGGGSQLSAPPGLELAGSQNVWEPPEGLLTQDVRDTVEILARNVLQRNFSQDFRATERQPASQPLSQQSSASQKSLGSESPHADLTPSRSGLSQDSASVAGASSSPANYLPAHDGRDGDFVDQGLLDMLAVLRGSQSQGGGGEDAHLSSPTESKRTQSPSQNLSQQPTGTPAPAAVDRAEAIAVTQKKQELEEEVLGKQMALAAQSEQYYDSDGSDDYHHSAYRTRPIVELATSASRAADEADPRTPAIDPPLRSQRSVSYPPWSQRGSSTTAGPARAASLPFWSQRSHEAGSAELPDSRSSETGGRSSEEMEMDSEDSAGSGGEHGAGDPMSQLSSRSLDDLEKSVRAKITRRGRGGDQMDSRRYSPSEGALLSAPETNFEPSELVGIISSQVEVEQDQRHNDDKLTRDGMDVIREDSEEQEEEQDVEHNHDRSDEEWTRGPIQLRYDDEESCDEKVTGGHESADGEEALPSLPIPNAEDQPVETSDPTSGESAGKSPLRLRGGVGLSRAKARPRHPLQQPTTARETRSDSSKPPDQGAADSTLNSQPTGMRRTVSWGPLDKRRTLGLPGAVPQRASSMPSGGFKPPRPATVSTLPIGDARISSSTTEGGDGRPERKRKLSDAESSADGSFAISATNTINGGSDTEDDDKPNTQDRRSQVVVPGWGSQGHHPVEYLESQLSFVTTAALRSSPNVARGSGSAATGTNRSVAGASKRQTIPGDRGARSPGDATSGKGFVVGEAEALSLNERVGGEEGRSEGDTAYDAKDSEESHDDPGQRAEEASLALAVVASIEEDSTLKAGKVCTGTESGVGATDVASRWRGADKRLRLAQRKGNSSTRSLLDGRRDDGCNDCNSEVKCEGEPPVSRAKASPSGVSREHEGKKGNEQNAESSGTRNGLGALVTPRSASPAVHHQELSEGHPQKQQRGCCAETPRQAGGRFEGGGGSSVSGRLEVTSRETTTRSSPLHAGSAARVVATPTPLSPLVLAEKQLSPDSDHSDMPPLAQQTPAWRINARHGGAPTNLRGSGRQWDGDRTGSEHSPLSPRTLLTPGEASTTCSTNQERLSGFTPPIPPNPQRPQHRKNSSGTVTLRPREEAPDPAMCTEALAKLGVPQVVYAEPYYSRKDDVPRRPREFAGKVFRIPHKDDLPEFDTLPSREEVLRARRRVETESVALQPRHRYDEARSSPTSAHLSPSPRSQPSVYAYSSSPLRGRSLGDADSRARDVPVAELRCLERWKEVAAAARSKTSALSFRRKGTVELVPVISPPPYKTVEAWSFANLGTSCRRRARDDLERPALRSTKNALGVLAGGGETDLAEEGSAEIHSVVDADTGQVVPVVPPKDRAAAPRQPTESVEIGAATPEEAPNTPPSGTPCSAPSCASDQDPRSGGGFIVETPRTASIFAKRATQGPHHPSNKSQISPTTQTPSSGPPGEEEEEGKESAARFAFGLGARHNARSDSIAAAAAKASAASPTAGGSQFNGLGLSGGFVAPRGSEDVAGAMGDRLTVLCLEIHVQVGASRRPDPRRDAVHAVCWRVKDAFSSSDREVVETSSGVIVLPLGMVMRGAVGGRASGREPASGSPAATCLKCGKPRDDDSGGTAKVFCTFEGGGFLGEEICRERTGRGTFCHGLGKGVEVLEVCSEAELFSVLVGVFCRHDPDFVVGWEVQGDSLGYVVERGFNMDPSMDMTRLLSRTPGRDADQRNANDEWGKTNGSGIWITGRTVLNMWRLMRSELKLCSYTLQSVAEHVLRKRIPSFSLQLRSKWFASRDVRARSRALAEPLSRVRACLSIMDKLDLVGRTSEMARLFGIDFFSVLCRGSQYRVEAVMLRVLKPRNYVTVSPSRNQVASQAAMESLPLVFEPRSRLYTSPVVVVDFQSLYPSMIIAYNLCYSTILGKFDPKTGGTSAKLGVLPYLETKTSEALAQAEEAHRSWGGRKQRRGAQSSQGSSSQASSSQAFREGSSGHVGGDDSQGALEGKARWDPRCIHVAANAAGFCHPSLRQGILPLMLREILETRVMIKGAMKRAEAAGQRVLARTLNARQYALKMISNVTYGYTAAGFSGRMPMAELADAIVESGRQTLIAAARMVDNHETWQASVVYGDTDSLFIELPGRSLEEAHRIGREIAAAVSESCPPDVILKFEKVYLPCILASKKRYVGHMYESPKDLKPSFDAKGIETVRRDGCPLLVKMLEKVIRVVFTTKDLSQVKGYLYRQWTRILTDRAAVGDFIFAKEVRLGTYASDVYMPPSAIVASKAMASDPRAEPKYCERVPYVVVAGPVGARLMDLVVSPEQFLAEGSGLRLNGKYYITKVINPALDRALALVGVDVNAWYNDMPRPAARVMPKARASAARGRGGEASGDAPWWNDASADRRRKKGKAACVITNFFISDRCSLCGDQCAKSVCGKCAREPAAKCVALSRLREADMTVMQLLELCRQCSGHAPTEVFGLESCRSLECPVFFERHRAMLKGREARELCDALGLLPA